MDPLLGIRKIGTRCKACNIVKKVPISDVSKTITRSKREVNFKLGEWNDQIMNRRVFLGAQKSSVIESQMRPPGPPERPQLKDKRE